MLLLFSIHYISYLNKSSQRVLVLVADSSAKQCTIVPFLYPLKRCLGDLEEG